MSEPKLISPMLDNFAMGDPISDHHGVRCCPAMKNDSDEKYIVKIIFFEGAPCKLRVPLKAYQIEKQKENFELFCKELTGKSM